MARKPFKKVYPHQVGAGDVIRMRGNGPDSMIKGMHIVFHLENGMDEVYESTEQVSLVERNAE